MISNRMFPRVAVALALILGSAGCEDSDSANADSSTASTETPSAARPASAMEREAQDAALAEVHKHWVKGPEGWTTARISGSPYSPDHYLRQFRELTVQGVEPYELSESDKLNGFEWAGEVSFKTGPGREAGDPGLAFDALADVRVMRQRGRWTQWVEFDPGPLKIQKQKGKWQFPPEQSLLHGKLPTPEDFAKAGVK